ncbi:MAG: class I SAM-dependent methyltransferase [gamma proteobacterium symbiont of Bathyaustriella thionipta]|nr:class I SAM-dependent methyltransferase [gamma proteobacterium symbiont of Bathyaustriella thionipta]
MEYWWQHDEGAALGHQLEVQLEQALRDCFGYYLLQMGASWFHPDYASISSIKHHFILQRQLVINTSIAQIIGDKRHLPIMTDTIDTVVLPFTLDFSSDPHQILREVERIMIPEGRLILFGFNPWYLAGLKRLKQSLGYGVPQQLNHLALGRLYDWLTLLGFDIEQLGTFSARPHSFRAARLARMGTSASLIPYPPKGLACMIKARKQVTHPATVGSLWTARRTRVSMPAAEPTTRNKHVG